MRISDPEHPDAENLRVLFQKLRGFAVSCFAEAEFAMGDLLSAMERTGRHSDTIFHYPVEKRLKAFRKACLDNAGDDEIKRRVEWATSGFEAAIDDRNALAHGAGKLFPEKRIVEILKFARTKQDKHRVLKFTYDLDAMEDRVREFDYITRNIMALSWSLSDVLGLTNQLEPSFQVIIEDNI